MDPLAQFYMERIASFPQEREIFDKYVNLGEISFHHALFSL